jgi:hypothetical protein
MAGIAAGTITIASSWSSVAIITWTTNAQRNMEMAPRGAISLRSFFLPPLWKKVA